MTAEVERVIINQCSPVLMGVKPAALFPFGCDCDYLSRFLPGNVELFVLRKTGDRFLLMLYEKTILEETVLIDAIRRFLSGLGYPQGSSIPYLLRYLKQQFEHAEFPHEVGLFLGYPMEDVLGFIEHKGQNYKFRGYWKVYGDVDKAKTCFRQYDLCRKCMYFSMLSGRMRKFLYQSY